MINLGTRVKITSGDYAGKSGEVVSAGLGKFERIDGSTGLYAIVGVRLKDDTVVSVRAGHFEAVRPGAGG